jgi:hypothetical protein
MLCKRLVEYTEHRRYGNLTKTVQKIVQALGVMNQKYHPTQCTFDLLIDRS